MFAVEVVVGLAGAPVREGAIELASAVSPDEAIL